MLAPKNRKISLLEFQASITSGQIRLPKSEHASYSPTYYEHNKFGNHPLTLAEEDVCEVKKNNQERRFC